MNDFEPAKELKIEPCYGITDFIEIAGTDKCIVTPLSDSDLNLLKQVFDLDGLIAESASYFYNLKYNDGFKNCSCKWCM